MRYLWTIVSIRVLEWLLEQWAQVRSQLFPISSILWGGREKIVNLSIKNCFVSADSDFNKISWLCCLKKLQALKNLVLPYDQKWQKCSQGGICQDQRMQVWKVAGSNPSRDKIVQTKYLWKELTCCACWARSIFVFRLSGLS